MDTDTYLLIGVLCLVIVLPIVCILGSVFYGCLCNRTNNNELVTELVNNTNQIENNKNTLEGYEEIDIKN